MLTLIALAGAVASGEPLVHARFDLTQMPGSQTETQQQARARKLYSIRVGEWDDGDDDDDGVQVKLHGTKVKLKVPI